MMQKHNHILIGSVLKPVNDTRMYEKMACSLIQQPNIKVSILGFTANQKPISEKIKFYSIFNFKRIGIKRLFAPIKFFFYLLKLQPNQLVINSHELLFPAVLYRIFTRTKLIYDVRENYVANLKHLPTLPAHLNSMAKHWVHFKERILSKKLDHIILAEQCYAKELYWVQHRPFTVIENKVAGCPKHIPVPAELHKLLFSGTLSNEMGLKKAISIAKVLQKSNKAIQLTIIGHAIHTKTQQYLFELADQNPWIHLIGITELVPHNQIVNAIQHADLGLITYPINAVNQHKVPTKLFEYSAYGLPFYHTQNKLWSTWGKKTGLGTAIVNDKQPELDLNKLSKQLQKHPPQPTNAVHWESDIEKFYAIFFDQELT